MNKVVSAIAVIVVAIAAVVIVYMVKGDNGKTEPIVSVDSIRSIMQLAVVDYHVSAHQQGDKPPKGLEWLHATWLVAMAGDVKGSVNLEAAELEIDEANKKVSIRFAEDDVLISNLEVDPESIRIIKCADPNIFHPITEEDYEKSEKYILAHLRAVAIEKGIVERTRTEARLALSNFLKGFGYEADIKFEGET